MPRRKGIIQKSSEIRPALPKFRGFKAQAYKVGKNVFIQVPALSPSDPVLTDLVTWIEGLHAAYVGRIQTIESDMLALRAAYPIRAGEIRTETTPPTEFRPFEPEHGGEG